MGGLSIGKVPFLERMRSFHGSRQVQLAVPALLQSQDKGACEEGGEGE